MELEFFVPPDQSQQWYEYWCAERLQWYTSLGIPPHLLRLRAHDADELSHYSSDTSDVEFLFPWGWGELEGIANRGDYDLHSTRRRVRLTTSTGGQHPPHRISSRPQGRRAR
jgi:glycyl-tRNA synthetase